MIRKKSAKLFCCEDISLIENYYEAVNDKTQSWELHHRLESELRLSKRELIESGRYYGVEAKYLIFLTKSEHSSLHQKLNNNFKCKKKNGMLGRHHTEESRRKMSINHKTPLVPIKKYKWMTPTGEIVEMRKSSVTRFHPDWKLIE